MLQQLLVLIEAHPGSLNQEQICTDLGISPASLQSMLDILVRKGRLIATSVDECNGLCQGCPIQHRCSDQSAPRERLYLLPQKS
jgi:hypothetical protein